MKLHAKLLNQKGFNLIELIIVIAILAVFIAIATQSYDNYVKNLSAHTMTKICVAEIQQDSAWQRHAAAKLYQKAMAFNPPPGVDLDEVTLQNTREACFDRIITAAAEAARQK